METAFGMTDGEEKRASVQEDRHPEDEALRTRTEVYRDHRKRGRQRPYHRDGDAVEVPPRLTPTGRPSTHMPKGPRIPAGSSSSSQGRALSSGPSVCCQPSVCATRHCPICHALCWGHSVHQLLLASRPFHEEVLSLLHCANGETGSKLNHVPQDTWLVSGGAQPDQVG